jgi:hypothetical protein
MRYELLVVAIRRLLNIATPPTAFAVVVLVAVKLRPIGFVMLMVTTAVATGFPAESFTRTLGAGAMASFAATLEGCCTQTIWAGGPGFTATLRASVVVRASASVTRTVKLEVAAVEGVPLSTPALLRVSPAGSVPEATAQVYGVAPPVAASA